MSISGDGGYNEVVNGIMAAGTGTAVAGVLGAGNANDHRRLTRQHPLIDSIVAGRTHDLDLLTLTIGELSDQDMRYAHSYLGLGLTAAVTRGLNDGDKGTLREVLTTLRTLVRFNPVVIDTDRGRESLDNLVFANISGMAKYATLSANGHPDDGQFEVIAQHHTSRWRLLSTALRAASTGLGEQPTATNYQFRTVAPIPLQIDGELIELPATPRPSPSRSRPQP